MVKLNSCRPKNINRIEDRKDAMKITDTLITCWLYCHILRKTNNILLQCSLGIKWNKINHVVSCLFKFLFLLELYSSTDVFWGLINKISDNCPTCELLTVVNKSHFSLVHVSAGKRSWHCWNLSLCNNLVPKMLSGHIFWKLLVRNIEWKINYWRKWCYNRK